LGGAGIGHRLARDRVEPLFLRQLRVADFYQLIVGRSVGRRVWFRCVAIGLIDRLADCRLAIGADFFLVRDQIAGRVTRQNLVRVQPRIVRGARVLVGLPAGLRRAVVKIGRGGRLRALNPRRLLRWRCAGCGCCVAVFVSAMLVPFRPPRWAS
jgi:hypothetical protein